MATDTHIDRKLTFVHPNELHDSWGLVKPGLEIVAKKSKATWLPEDIYTELRAGRSTLHICDVENEYAGFVVLTPQQGFDCSTLFVWATYSPNPRVHIIEIFLDDIKSMARQMKAKKVGFMSCREGWGKRAESLGFSPVQTQYSMEV